MKSLLSLVFLVSTALAANSTSDTYVAAVVEIHHSTLLPFDDEQLDKRVTEFEQFIDSAADSSADIIVFPESTLTAEDHSQAVPEASDGIVPCDNATYSGPLGRISCAARNRSIYVVINLTMRRPCDSLVNGRPCDEPWSLYNTNVVLDRRGVVISVYRKVNPFGETGISTTAVPDVSTFHTDFGVEFGHFICFDLLFHMPAKELVRRGVRNFAFPTMWFAELPFLSGVQAQQGWAFANNVNFLAAGANNAKYGSTGSGIYAGRAGPLKSLMTDAPASRLLISTIPKLPAENAEPLPPVVQTESVANIIAKRDISAYTYVPLQLDAAGGQMSGSLYEGGQTCWYRYEVQVAPPIDGQMSYEYFLVMFNGIKSYDGFADGALRLCAIVGCTNATDTTTCGRTFPATATVQQRYTFTELEIGGTFATTAFQGNLTMPTTLTTGLLPLNSRDFHYAESTDDQFTNVTMTLATTNRTRLMTFGVYSVAFSSSASTQRVSGVVLGIALLFAWRLI